MKWKYRNERIIIFIMLENNIRRWNQWLVLIINWHHWFWWFISFWRSIQCILCLLFRKRIAICRIDIIATMSVIIKPPIKNNNKTCVDMNTALMQRFSLHNVRSYQIIYVISVCYQKLRNIYFTIWYIYSQYQSWFNDSRN